MNDSAILSNHWYRVSALHPRLQPGTRVHRHIVRGVAWFVFTHPFTGRHHRLNRKAYELAGRLDGERNLDLLWKGLQQHLGEDAPTQDEVIAMLAQMNEAGLVLFDVMPDWAALHPRSQQRRAQERRASLNPFAFRVRLFDPSALVDRLSFLQPCIAHPFALVLALSLFALAAFNLVAEWRAITAYASVHLLTPRALLLTWLLYPILKGLHELAHALVVRRFGGTVKEAGIGFLILMPAPYVDASAAISLPSKWQRAAVSAAGIVFELLCASIALLVWLHAADGWIRDIAFSVMVIGGLSTIVFNANPLLRFDGYYILCDVFELPNLASRSQRWWSTTWQRLLRHGPKPSAADFRERLWLIAYTPASWLYRLFISAVIVQWITRFSVLLGFVAMLWLALLLLAKPIWSVLAIVFAPAHPAEQVWRVRLGTIAVCGIAAAAAFWLPIPSSTLASGVVWLPEQTQVRTASDARVVHMLAANGQWVERGDIIAELDEPQLRAQAARLRAKLWAAETENASGWTAVSAQGRNALEEVARLREEIAFVHGQIDKLTLRAGVSGLVVQPRLEQIDNMHLTKGSILAYVLPNDPTLVRVAVGHEDIARLNGLNRHISVRFADEPHQAHPARLHRIDPAATTMLPSRAMGDKGGGPLPTDPNDPDGLRLLQPVFMVDVQLDERSTERVGGRAWVRFEHAPQPLADTLAWRLRQLFLRTFSWEAI